MFLHDAARHLHPSDNRDSEQLGIEFKEKSRRALVLPRRGRPTEGTLNLNATRRIAPRQHVPRS